MVSSKSSKKKAPPKKKYAPVLAAIKKAIEEQVSGFHKLKFDTIENKSQSKVELIAYECYIRQRLARWGGRTGDQILAMETPDVERRLLRKEKKWQDTNIVNKKKDGLKSQDQIVAIFVNEYGSGRRASSRGPRASGKAAGDAAIIPDRKTFLARNCTGRKDAWTVPELKATLKAAGLPVKGNKTELCARLNRHFLKQSKKK